MIVLVQTDPNWGNFLYDEATKTINLIDFGAARDYPKSFVDDYLRMVILFPRTASVAKKLQPFTLLCRYGYIYCSLMPLHVIFTEIMMKPLSSLRLF